MAESKRLLVLCIDVDNDLGEKARVPGPIVGRKANIDAAMKLGIADPEDSDVNTVFEAVRIFDDLSKEHKDVQVATITGSAKGGYAADREVIKQLEKIMDEFKPEACVFVSDGASDETILPVVQSRIKINSVRTVTVKQTKELEKTYFVILDKLKEPHFARIVFGIPGILLLLFAFSTALGFRVVLGILGLYLVVKGLGIEDRLLKGITNNQISAENQNFVFTFVAATLTVLAFLLGVASTIQANASGLDSLKLAASFVRGTFPLFPIAILVFYIGQALEGLSTKKLYLIPRHIVYGGIFLLFWLVFNNASEWILGSVSFADFVITFFLSAIAMYLVSALSREFRRSFIAKLHLEGKEAYTEIGGFIGKVVGINKKAETFIIQTGTGQKIDLDLDHISGLGEKIIVRY